MPWLKWFLCSSQDQDFFATKSLLQPRYELCSIWNVNLHWNVTLYGQFYPGLPCYSRWVRFPKKLFCRAYSNPWIITRAACIKHWRLEKGDRISYGNILFDFCFKYHCNISDDTILIKLISIPFFQAGSKNWKLFEWKFHPITRKVYCYMQNIH